MTTFINLEIFLFVMGINSIDKQSKLEIENASPSPMQLSTAYKKIHNIMRNVDGLQPQESFDELLKLLFVKENHDVMGKDDVSIMISNSTSLDQISNAINNLFARLLKIHDSWFLELWSDMKFHLSDKALSQAWLTLSAFDFSTIPYDVRGLAMREFLDEKVRRSLGIYLTPDEIVKMMVEIVSPSKDSLIYDPACGSGTFLIESLKFEIKNYNIDKQLEIWGTDRNPRMLLLSQLNLGSFHGIKFNQQLLDALFPENNETFTWPKENMFDVILTNPPFGVVMDNYSYDLRKFKTCLTKDMRIVEKQQSEILFLEKCLGYLKPSGILSIVLPRSVITNGTLSNVREILSRLGYIYGVVSLPPETFAVSGTQTNTIVLFIKKFKDTSEPNEDISIFYSEITYIGYDSTGRVRKGGQISEVTSLVNSIKNYKNDSNLLKLFSKVKKGETFVELPKLLKNVDIKGETVTLRNLVSVVMTGKTPPRIAYSDEGLFLVKVGNLTGNGIEWAARDRNFIDKKTAKKNKYSKFMLQPNDILMTSSAHSPIYIGKKVDIVSEIPDKYNCEAAFVGEIMLIRPDGNKIDPFAILAYLRSPKTTESIQKLIRGQTAHIYSKDLLELQVPVIYINPDSELKKLITLLKEEAKISVRMNKIIFKEQDLLERINN